MIKKQQTPFNLFLHVPAYCKSLCFGNKFFLRYWGHSRYWSILASKILGSDFRFSPLLDSLLAFPDSSKITTSSTLNTARARAIYKSNTQRIQILKQDFTCRGMQFLDKRIKVNQDFWFCCGPGESLLEQIDKEPLIISLIKLFFEIFVWRRNNLFFNKFLILLHCRLLIKVMEYARFQCN